MSNKTQCFITHNAAHTMWFSSVKHKTMLYAVPDPTPTIGMS